MAELCARPALTMKRPALGPADLAGGRPRRHKFGRCCPRRSVPRLADGLDAEGPLDVDRYSGSRAPRRIRSLHDAEGGLHSIHLNYHALPISPTQVPPAIAVRLTKGSPPTSTSVAKSCTLHEYLACLHLAGERPRERAFGRARMLREIVNQDRRSLWRRWAGTLKRLVLSKHHGNQRVRPPSWRANTRPTRETSGKNQSREWHRATACTRRDSASFANDPRSS